MQHSSGLNRMFSALAALTMAVAGLCLCGMVLVLAWQVFGRYVLNDSPGWTEPAALTLMSVAALFGAAIAVRRETHFSFPTLVEKSPAPVRAALKALSRLIALGFGAALAGYGGFQARRRVSMTWNRSSSRMSASSSANISDQRSRT